MSTLQHAVKQIIDGCRYVRVFHAFLRDDDRMKERLQKDEHKTLMSKLMCGFD
jgi:hypothetical protein